MSVQVPCPTCRAILTIRPGAATIRCAVCNTTLAVESDAAPPPAAPPLPFARPKPPAAPARRTPVPPPPAKAPPKPPAAPVVKRTPIDRERQRQIEDELAAMDQAEEKEQRRLERVGLLLKQARTGVWVLSLGCQGAAFATLLAFFGMVTSIFGMFLPAGVFFLGAGLMVVLHVGLTLVGFGFCTTGPRGMRPLAVGGMVLTVAHVLALVFAFVHLAFRFALGDLAAEGDGAVTGILVTANLSCNLMTVSSVPLFALLRLPPTLYLIPLVAAGLEFGKISAIGVLTNRYASAGKDPELGYLGLRFVYRLFGLVVVAAMVLPLIWLGNQLLAGGGWGYGFRIAIAFGVNAYYLWWSFSWYAQYQVMRDTLDVMEPARFLDKRDRVDDGP